MFLLRQITFYEINEWYAQALMLIFTVITGLLIYGLFKYSVSAYQVYGVYSVILSLICTVVGLGVMAEALMTQLIMDSSLYFIIVCSFCFIPSSFTAYICLVKKQYLVN